MERFQGSLDTAQDHFLAGRPDWTPTTAEIAEHFLNVMPPVYGPGLFACSEPYSDTSAWEPVYLAFRNVNDAAGTAECRYMTRREIIAGKPVATPIRSWRSLPLAGPMPAHPDLGQHAYMDRQRPNNIHD